MHEFHELTERLKFQPYWSDREFLQANDEVVRQWLSEKAKKIASHKSILGQVSKEYVGELLGLESKQEICQHNPCNAYCDRTQPATQVVEKKWCIHIVWKSEIYHKPNYYFDNGEIHTFNETNGWNNCPICGTPRPKEKSLVEKFLEYFRHSPGCEDYESESKSLAKIATQHFESRKDGV